MKFKMRQKATRWGRGLWAALVTLFVFGTVSPAHAAFVLAFDLDGNPLVGAPVLQVFDNLAGDSNPAVGVITFIGSVGAFSVNVSTAISKPVIGPLQLDLNSVNVTTYVGTEDNGAGTITIIASDTGYVFAGPGPQNLVSKIGGVVPYGGTVTALQGVDLLNALYGMFFFNGAVHFVSHGPFGPGAFADTKNVGFVAGGFSFPLFSLTEAVTITHTSAGATSFNIASQVPEPATLVLLALGLVGMAVFARRRAR